MFNSIEIKKKISLDEAKWAGKKLGVNLRELDFEEFRIGMEIELEHGRQDFHTNITNDELITTGKIALTHLNEYPDYYSRLLKMEKEAKRYWENKN